MLRVLKYIVGGPSPKPTETGGKAARHRRGPSKGLGEAEPMTHKTKRFMILQFQR